MGTVYNYRLVVTKVSKTGKRTYVKLSGTNCHELKSLAGSVFQKKNVVSVFVCDVIGNHFLYLVKNHPEKTENVPSLAAIL